MQAKDIITLVKAQAARENARKVTLHERGDSWEVGGKPSELWLSWALGEVWWEPECAMPWWAPIVRGEWDSVWS